MTGRAGLFGHLGGRDRRHRVVRRKVDAAVLTVTVRAHRRIGLATRHELTVDAIVEIALDASVALAAGGRNIKWLIEESGNPGDRILYAVPLVEWQSLHVAAK